MKMKKVLAIILAALLLLSAAACAKDGGASSAPSGGLTEEDLLQTGGGKLDATVGLEGVGITGGTTIGFDYNFDASLYPADTVVMTVGGADVMWDEFVYWVNYAANKLYQNYGYLPGLDETDASGTSTAEFLLDYAKSCAVRTAVVAKNAEALGVSISDENEAEIESILAELKANFATEEELNAKLSEIYMNVDLYEKLVRATMLEDALFIDQYGADGSLLSDDELNAYAESVGYLYCKHILVETEAEANALIARLDAHTGDIEDLFTQLMNENTTDPGVQSFPDGYLYGPGVMYPEFEAATKALSAGDYTSEAVPSTSGYHIILRLPIDGNMEPIQYAGTGVTLYYAASFYLFETVIEGWTENAEITESDALVNLDTSKFITATAVKAEEKAEG